MVNQIIQGECGIYASMDRAIIGLDNGLFPVQHQVVIWTYASLLMLGPLITTFSEVWSKIQ